ncbi:MULTISPECIES: ferritin-like domain-containing protein [Solirubrobacterales]|uniref:ferritin-like domain-containing protein n=1 Tax=Solirubrobacterales TaxID=588673 RepID=UPI0012B73D9F|nr:MULTISPECIES: ferritin-like domain-containing protein [Solirubrobacterales]
MTDHLKAVDHLVEDAPNLDLRNWDGTNRAQFLRRAGGGFALVAGGSVLASATPTYAQSSGPTAKEILDTAFIAENLAVFVYTAGAGLKFAKSNSRTGVKKGQKFFTGRNAVYLKAALKNEQDHRDFLGNALGSAKPTVPQFQVPKSAVASPLAVLKFALALETAFVSTYLGAIKSGALDAATTLVAAQVAANEASHQGFFSFATGGKGVTKSLPDTVTLAQATTALSPYFKS